MIEAPANHNPAKFAVGFYDRLEFLMVICGYRKHGILTSIAHVSGLSVAGARLLKTNNRPPRESNLSPLVSHLTKEINALGKGVVSTDEVQAFLLDNTEIAVLSGIAGFVDDGLINTDYAASVVMLILESIVRNKLDISDIEKQEVIQLVVTRILKYCAVNKPDFDSTELRSVIDSMVSLATTSAARTVLLSQ